MARPRCSRNDPKRRRSMVAMTRRGSTTTRATVGAEGCARTAVPHNALERPAAAKPVVRTNARRVTPAISHPPAASFYADATLFDATRLALDRCSAQTSFFAMPARSGGVNVLEPPSPKSPYRAQWYRQSEASSDVAVIEVADDRTAQVSIRVSPPIQRPLHPWPRDRCERQAACSAAMGIRMGGAI